MTLPVHDVTYSAGELREAAWILYSKVRLVQPLKSDCFGNFNACLILEEPSVPLLTHSYLCWNFSSMTGVSSLDLLSYISFSIIFLPSGSYLHPNGCSHVHSHVLHVCLHVL
jgi:hypothetical protein